MRQQSQRLSAWAEQPRCGCAASLAARLPQATERDHPLPVSFSSGKRGCAEKSTCRERADLKSTFVAQSAGRHEPQAQLEAPAALRTTPSLLGAGVRWLSATVCTSSARKPEPGTVGSRRGAVAEVGSASQRFAELLARVAQLSTSTAASTAQRCLTRRSSRGPTAGQQARDTPLPIMRLAGLPSHRWPRLSSNVRPRLEAPHQSVNTPRRGVSACELVPSLRLRPCSPPCARQGTP